MFIARIKKACLSSSPPPHSLSHLAIEWSLITICLCISSRCSLAKENQCLAYSYIVILDWIEHTYLKSNVLCHYIYLYFIMKNKCPLQVMDHLYCHSIAMCFTDVCKWILGWTPLASEPWGSMICYLSGI